MGSLPHRAVRPRLVWHVPPFHVAQLGDFHAPGRTAVFSARTERIEAQLQGALRFAVLMFAVAEGIDVSHGGPASA